MADGHTYKRCTCRNAAGKRLGTNCPKIKRATGAWSAVHGRWYYQLELPPMSDGTRRNPLRRGGFDSKTDAEDEMGKARELLAIPAPDDDSARQAMTDLITATIRETRALPDVETVRRKVRTGQDLARRMLVGEWLAEFLKRKKGLAPNTWRSYESHIRLYFTPYLGQIPLDRLRPGHIADMFEAIEETNEIIREARASGELRAKVKGQRISGPSSQRRYLATLRHALNIVMKHERLIDFNPAAAIELPSGDRPKPLVWTDERVKAWTTAHQERVAAERERRGGKRIDVIGVYVAVPRPSPVMVWTPAQTSAFLAYAHTHHRLFALYRLIALRGLRRGEACGLRWSELDRTTATLGVNWQITQLGWETAQAAPKTQASDRTVALDAETMAMLHGHLLRQRKERLAAGPDWQESGFIFTTEAGAPLHPAFVTKQFHWLTHQAGLPPIRLHDLRHGAASLMLAAGVEMKVVAETLGHTSTTFTRDTYTAVFPQVAAAAAESTAALLPKASR
ncbi:tyrosine-type recombinase/integrase [Spongiactinospora rosea]|nr:tyrosine-type recombinase/integrase [Spongiactinospora rosea]